MANNVPVSPSSIGKTPTKATSGGGVQTGPPEGKRGPYSGDITPDTMTAKGSIKSEPRSEGP